MKEQFVSYEIALKLKELGFDEECLACFQMHGYSIRAHKLIIPTWDEEYLQYETGMKDIADTVIYAPLWQQAIDWFREKYKLYITITSQSQESWQWHIQFPHDSLDKLWEEDFYEYEEAREQAILKAIELCQKEK